MYRVFDLIAVFADLDQCRGTSEGYYRENNLFNGKAGYKRFSA